jgi:peptidoglycan/LPS O-acetylase OafA/YrhL
VTQTDRAPESEPNVKDARDPLWRLAVFERRHRLGEPSMAKMGYSPSLDGLRAISVIAVILYHAGFGWAHGGFYGVEVFFVVSGFLITSLLLEERERTERVALGAFWARRARRLLPALFTMLIAVSLWAWMFGTREQESQLRRDLPWSIFYVANWGQIFGKAAYYSPVDPPLLRHLWSLAVEEQWYLVWPLAFIGLAVLGWSRRSTGTVLVGTFAAIWLWMWWLTRHGLTPPVRLPDPFGGGTAVTDRTNVLYLSTFTRAGGLLLGAGAAYLWRPWRRPRAPEDRVQLIEAWGMGALVGLVLVFGSATLTEPYTFQWLLPLVSLLSVIAVAAAVHPQAYMVRGLLSRNMLVEIGRRSYGLYLWHWPIFVFVGVDHGHIGSFVWAAVLTAAVSEVCYRYIETPIRKGSIHRFARRLRAQFADRSARAVPPGLIVIAVPALLVLVLASHYVSLPTFDRAAGGADTGFVLPATATATATGVATTSPLAAPSGASAATVPSVGAGASSTSAVATPVAAAANAPLPRRVVLVGDSTAHSLAINLPKGIGATFAITDGSIDGCGIFEQGVVSSTSGYKRTLTGCSGEDARWASSASGSKAQLAMVVVGAWDVLNIQVDGTTLVVGTPQHDAAFLAHLGAGVDALAATGAHVVLLQIPCMRPQEVKGEGTPPLPERADDARVAHLNALMQQLAASEPAKATYVTGPTEWCSDPAIASSLAYRWDGVHVYKPGATLIYETIAPSLLAIPVAG